MDQVCRIDGRCDCLSDTNDHTVAVGFDHVIFVIIGFEGFSCVGDSFQDLYFVALLEGLGGLGVCRNLDFLADMDQVRVCNPVISRDFLVGCPVLLGDLRQCFAGFDSVDHFAGGRFILCRLFDRGAQAAVDFGRDFAVAVIQIITRTSLVCIIAVNGHIAPVQVIHTVLFVGGPYKALDPVSLADVSHQVKKRGERLFIDRVRVLCIGRDFDRDRSVIVGRGRTTPGTILFFHIHSDFAVEADPIV